MALIQYVFEYVVSMFGAEWIFPHRYYTRVVLFRHETSYVWSNVKDERTVYHTIRNWMALILYEVEYEVLDIVPKKILFRR